MYVTMTQSGDMLPCHPWFPDHWPQRTEFRRDGEGGGSVERNCVAVLQKSDSGLLLCQINIEVSGAPHCTSISACCSEGGKGCVTWELPLSSFILANWL